jgi:NAD(P)-dependent dehydrogenase (short-subunit alcohol dehydrogenase family)
MLLKDKIVIVTGATGLIGKTVVADIAEQGGTAICADISNQTDIKQGIVHCDVTDPDSISRTFDLVYKTFGRIDGLVNSAYPRTKDWGNKFEDVNNDSWKKNIDMQMNSIFTLCHQVFPFMKEQQAGSIVNITSIYGVVGPDFLVYEGTPLTMPAAYSAIKGGIINFTRYLASYFGPWNIRANCISPGGIFDNQPDTFVKNYERKVPMKRMGKPEDISGPVSFLLSDKAAYVTGHNLIVDGGWTII